MSRGCDCSSLKPRIKRARLKQTSFMHEQWTTTHNTSDNTANLHCRMFNMLTLKMCTRKCRRAMCDTENWFQGCRKLIAERGQELKRPTGSVDTVILILLTFLGLYGHSFLNSSSKSAWGCIRLWQHYIKKNDLPFKTYSRNITLKQTTHVHISEQWKECIKYTW